MAPDFRCPWPPSWPARARSRRPSSLLRRGPRPSRRPHWPRRRPILGPRRPQCPKPSLVAPRSVARSCFRSPTAVVAMAVVAGWPVSWSNCSWRSFTGFVCAPSDKQQQTAFGERKEEPKDDPLRVSGAPSADEAARPEVRVSNRFRLSWGRPVGTCWRRAGRYFPKSYLLSHRRRPPNDFRHLAR